jgi:Arc/MetJ-type ribon-helix-helix transcriptional regulator
MSTRRASSRFDRKAGIAAVPFPYYISPMKTLTVRLPDMLAAQIEAESRRRNISKSDVVRERLTRTTDAPSNALDAVADLIGSVDAAPADLSARRKDYLAVTSYGRKRPR